VITKIQFKKKIEGIRCGSIIFTVKDGKIDDSNINDFLSLYKKCLNNLMKEQKKIYHLIHNKEMDQQDTIIGKSIRYVITWVHILEFGKYICCIGQ